MKMLRRKRRAERRHRPPATQRQGIADLLTMANASLQERIEGRRNG